MLVLGSACFKTEQYPFVMMHLLYHRINCSSGKCSRELKTCMPGPVLQALVFHVPGCCQLHNGASPGVAAMHAEHWCVLQQGDSHAHVLFHPCMPCSMAHKHNANMSMLLMNAQLPQAGCHIAYSGSAAASNCASIVCAVALARATVSAQRCWSFLLDVLRESGLPS